MPFNLGVSELLIIMVILLLVFGARRLPEIGSSMGKGIREFKRSIKDMQDSIDDDASPPPRQIDSPQPPQGGDGEPKKLSE
jgi:sec-independent protein translocase protein TatA